MKNPNQEGLSLAEYIGHAEIREVAWATDAYLLPAGSILVLSNHMHGTEYIFESLDPAAPRYSSGLLTITEGSTTITDRVPARVRLVSHAPALAQLYMPYVEFEGEEQGRKWRIWPAWQDVFVAHSEELAARALMLKLENERRRPLESDAAQRTISGVIRYYKSLSDTADRGAATEAALIARRLETDFSK